MGMLDHKDCILRRKVVRHVLLVHGNKQEGKDQGCRRNYVHSRKGD